MKTSPMGYLQQTALQPGFPSFVLVTDEATFTQEGTRNNHYTHVWAHENPNATRLYAYQERFSINVREDMVQDYLIGPYILPHRLKGRTHGISCNRPCQEFLADVPGFLFDDESSSSIVVRLHTFPHMSRLTWTLDWSR
ncbi:hypothetical protein PR048_011070 [Dryococelus australis]|uniref:Uncharacterized protein n=1 Tax=Dryococelus australis TaxID=614101 RepID=A0ABQ9HL41_9NEOP|nr:hypothetical protein PR048_011070 [Dryococelus australis]